MKKATAITADIHADSMFKQGIYRLLQETDDFNLKGIDVRINGDLAPAFKVPLEEGKERDNPRYAEKKRVRKDLAEKVKSGELDITPAEIEKRARAAEKIAAEKYRDEMIDYAEDSLRYSHDIVDYIRGLVPKWLNPVLLEKGNSTKIVSDDQLILRELPGRKKEPVLEDLIDKYPRAIKVIKKVRVDRYGDALLITIPYTENKKVQKSYTNQLKRMLKRSGVKDVFAVYHENRFPEMVGMEGKPVVMNCLHEMMDIVKSKYPGAKVHEVVGHNHVIRKEDYMVETPDKTLLIPVGIDFKTLNCRTLLIKPGEEPKPLYYQM